MLNSIDANLSAELTARRDEIAAKVVDQHFSARPHIAARYGDRGRVKCIEDTKYHLSYLNAAVLASSSRLFSDYVLWAAIMLESRGIPSEEFEFNLRSAKEVFLRELSAEVRENAVQYVDEGLALLAADRRNLPSFVDGDDPLSVLAREYLQALLDVDVERARALIRDAVQRDTPIHDLYLYVFERTQKEVGRLWQLNKASEADEHFCTAATQHIVAGLYPQIFSGKRTGRSAVVACVSGELHDFGARMVADMLDIDGWRTFYLGANTPSESILETTAKVKGAVLCLSTTITYHVAEIRKIISMARTDKRTADLRIIVGGYPFNIDPDLWRRVGADGHAENALKTVSLARETSGG